AADGDLVAHHRNDGPATLVVFDDQLHGVPSRCGTANLPEGHAAPQAKLGALPRRKALRFSAWRRLHQGGARSPWTPQNPRFLAELRHFPRKALICAHSVVQYGSNFSSHFTALARSFR